MLARLISVVVAVLATLIALPLLWSGGAQFLAVVSRGSPGVPVPGLIAWIVGAIFLAAACATVVVSSAGILVTGVAHLAMGLVSLMLAVSPLSPALGLARLLDDIDPSLAAGEVIFLVGGIAVALGVVQIVTAVVVRGRRRRPSAGVSLLVALGAGIVLTLGILLELWWGSDVYRASFRQVRFDLVAAILCVVAAFVIGAATIGVRWSGVTLVIPGVLLSILSIVAVAAPRLVFELGALNVIDTVFTLQAPALAAALVALGIASSVRARRQYAPRDAPVSDGVQLERIDGV